MFKNTIKVYSGLNRNVYAIFLLMLISATGFFVFPYLTLILTTKFGYDTEHAGYWVTATSIAGFIGMLVFGKIADIFGRRRILIIILSISFVCASLCAVLYRSTILPYLILVMTFCMMGVRPIDNAIITDTTPAKDRSRAFALPYLGLNIGAAMGNIVAGYLFNDYMWLMFIICAAASLGAVIVTIKFIDETKPSEADIDKTASGNIHEKSDHSNALVILLKKPILFAFAIIFIFYTFVYAQNFFTLPLHLKQLFGADGARGYAHQNALNCILVIFLTTPLAALIRNNNPIKNVVISGILYSIGFGILFFNVPNIWFFYLSTFIWTVGEIICYPGMNAFISNHSPINKRGALNSVVSSIGFIGIWLGASVNGYLIKSYGVVNMWSIVFAVSILTTAAMWILYTVDKGHKKRTVFTIPDIPPAFAAQSDASPKVI